MALAAGLTHVIVPAAVRDDDAVRGGAQRGGLDAERVGASRVAALVADRARDESARAGG